MFGKHVYLWCTVRETESKYICDARSEKPKAHIFVMHGQRNWKHVYLWCTVRETESTYICDARSEKPKARIFVMHGQRNRKHVYLFLSDPRSVDKIWKYFFSLVWYSQNILEYFSLPLRTLKYPVFTNFILEVIIKWQTQNLYLVCARLSRV